MAPLSENPLGEYFAFLRRHARLIATVSAACVVLTILVALIRPRRYSASATLAPQQSELTRSGLAGLAAQFGVALPMGEGAESPAFYSRLLGSASLLREVVEARLPRPNTGDSATLIEIWKVAGRTPEIRREATVERLARAMTQRADNDLGIVEFTVRTKDARLSQALAEELLKALNRFNLERRQTRASAERQFAEQHRLEAREELRSAERDLERFLEANRRFSDSPNLMAVRDRLQREVTFRQQVYSSLSQAYEQARLEEVRDTPVFTVVERPILPARPDPRGLTSQVAVSLLVGLLLGIGAALLQVRFPELGNALRDKYIPRWHLRRRKA